ncbi:MAG: hypothetical protein SH857_07665 [Chitinophagales bacterium]|nr:hypothetical protein [Chitinophagales bacterium]
MNANSENQINAKVIELFKEKKTLNTIKSQVELAYNCTVEYNTLARIIRLHLGNEHRLFVRK